MVAPKRLQKNWTAAIIILLIWISLATSILFHMGYLKRTDKKGAKGYVWVPL